MAASSGRFRRRVSHTIPLACYPAPPDLRSGGHSAVVAGLGVG
jgi:hypothetical protein